MKEIEVYTDTARALERIAEQRQTTIAELIDEMAEQTFGADWVKDELKKQTKPEAFYTGGGIWLSAMYGEGGRNYFVVDNEFPECLTCYDHNGEDQEDEFPCQNMVWSVEKKDLSRYQLKTYYKPLLAALKKEVDIEEVEA